MYLTAQRVRAPTGFEGINAFYYRNGVDVWAPAFHPPVIPDQDPGELAWQIVTLAPPGNNVRSYLDIVAADLTPVSTVRRSFAALAASFNPEQLPFEVEVDPYCWFRFNAEQALAHVWRQESRLLLEWAILAYQPPG